MPQSFQFSKITDLAFINQASLGQWAGSFKTE